MEIQPELQITRQPGIRGEQAVSKSRTRNSSAENLCAKERYHKDSRSITYTQGHGGAERGKKVQVMSRHRAVYWVLAGIWAEVRRLVYRYHEPSLDYSIIQLLNFFPRPLVSLSCPHAASGRRRWIPTALACAGTPGIGFLTATVDAFLLCCWLPSLLGLSCG
jgi:hypothetical protein